MLTKNAIGISVNGTKVKAAYLSSVGGNLYIRALESATLVSPLESTRTQQKSEEKLNETLESAFDVPETTPTKSTPSEESSSEISEENNVGILYALIDKFQEGKVTVGINTPVLTVKYEMLETEVLPKDKNLKRKIKAKLDIWGNEIDESRRTNYLKINNERLLKVDYDYHPPLIDLVEEVNQFRAGNLNLVHMDTNELALVDLVKELYKFDKHEITALIYIEQDFSRAIFLKGTDLYHITPIIHKGTTSKDVLEVIYRKIIYAQDHYFIPELNNIILASYSYRLKANKYFKQKFPYAETGYINHKKIIPDPKFRKGGRLFSQYAIPISLAWKALQNKPSSSKNLNFLPEYILQRQTMPRLETHGYALMGVLALTAFIFTGLLLLKNVEIRDIKQKNKNIQAQIEYNKPLSEKVEYFNKQIRQFENTAALVDSFSKGYEETVEFLGDLHASLRTAGDVWITELTKQGLNVSIKGIALRRDRIPVLSNALGGAGLKKVTRSTLYDQRVFSFHLEKKLKPKEEAEEETKPAPVDPLTILNSANGDAGSSGNGSTAPTSEK